MTQDTAKDLEIAKLKQQLAAFQQIETHLIPLPNGDLHRGFKANSPLANIDVEVIPESSANPLDRAVAKCLTAAKGGEPLTCLWCGLQYGSRGGEKDLREHLKKDHASIVSGYDAVVPEILMANLEEAKARLAEATS